MSVENITRHDGNTMTYKIMNKLCPEDLLDKCFQRSSISSYNTRNRYDLDILRYKLQYSKKGFLSAALRPWNELPLAIRESATLNGFKKQLKTYLKSWTSYNTNPWSNSISLPIGLKFFIVKILNPQIFI